MMGFYDYEVSSHGRVRSMDRQRITPHPRNAKVQHVRSLRGCLLTPTPDKNGYLEVTLRRNGTSVKRKVAHLVLEVFVGPRPGGAQACHFPDKTVSSNCVSNLRWGNAKDNRRDQDIHKTSPVGERHWNARLSQEQVDKIRRRLLRGDRQVDIAADMCVRPQVINHIAKGRTWAVAYARPGTPWREEEFIRCLEQPSCKGMVAEHEDRVVGFMIYELNKTQIQVLNFATAADCFRKGVGAQMLSKLIRKLSAKRRTEITVKICETNLPAQLFFRDAGFRVVSILRDEYDETPEDAYLMRYRFRPKQTGHQTLPPKELAR